MTRSLTMLLAVFFAALTISSTCAAEPATSGVVHYNDLDLSRAGDVRILHKRIERAANAMCLHATGPSPAATIDATCKTDAVQTARRQVEAPPAEREASAPELTSRKHS